MTTLKDLGRHLNLSVVRISRAFNDRADAIEKTRRRAEAEALRQKDRIEFRDREAVAGDPPDARAWMSDQTVPPSMLSMAARSARP